MVTKKQKEIALNAWYSCMIAMGSIPLNEDLYFEAQKIFFEKYKIKDPNIINTTCDEDLASIKDAYNNLYLTKDQKKIITLLSEFKN